MSHVPRHLERRQSQTALVHAIDHHIAIRLGTCGALRGEVGTSKRRRNCDLSQAANLDRNANAIFFVPTSYRRLEQSPLGSAGD